MEAHAPIITPRLSFSGTTAERFVLIQEADKQIEATPKPWDGENLLDSWSGCGNDILRLERSSRVTRGKSYIVNVYGTIRGNF